MGHTVLTVFAEVVVPLFFIGIVGSTVVVLVTLIQDVRDITKADHDVVTDL